MPGRGPHRTRRHRGLAPAATGPHATLLPDQQRRPRPTTSPACTVVPDTEDAGSDVVLLGGAGPEFSYTQMNHALKLLLDGAQLVGMHRNLYWRTADGFSLDTGAYLAALELAAGVEATVLGKPSPDFFRAGLRELGLEASEVAMVGDDVENDVLGAQAAGIRGILVRTGKYRADAVAAASGEPDAVIDSFVDLPKLLGDDHEDIDPPREKS
jgi:HAD superfamily hydrolase (TIGR01458 family)